MRRLVVVCVLAVLFSAAVGYVDTHAKTDDNLPMVLLLLVVTFLFGVAQPKQAWLWALIVGLGIPLAHLLGLLVGYRPPYPVGPNVFVTFIALVPAFIGAYLGVLARSVGQLLSTS
jgi:NO-binding membrane sensor protein with MHYT domain